MADPTTSPQDPVPRVSLAAIQDPDTLSISVQSRPTPVPKGAQVLIRLSSSGLCAADLHLARRHLPYLLPTVRVFGHEGAGTIASLGPDAEPSRWKVGDHVGIRWLHSVCASCEQCTTGYENLCTKRLITGKDVEGAFAEYAVAESRYLVKLPDGLEDWKAAPVLCAGVTVYKGLKVAGLRKGSWVAVSGAGGGLGHLAVQYARAMGMRVVGLDVDKRSICLELGAEGYVEVAGNEHLADEVVRVTSGGAHAVLVCASSTRAYADAVRYLRRAGTLVCIGAPVKSENIPVSPEDFIARGIRIVGTSTGTLEDTEEALAFVARGEVTPRVQETGLDTVEQALQQIEDGKVEGRLVVRIQPS